MLCQVKASKKQAITGCRRASEALNTPSRLLYTSPIPCNDKALQELSLIDIDTFAMHYDAFAAHNTRLSPGTRKPTVKLVCCSCRENYEMSHVNLGLVTNFGRRLAI